MAVMHSSPVAFRKQPVDDVCVQLIGRKDGNADNASNGGGSAMTEDLGVAKKTNPCNLCQKVFNYNWKLIYPTLLWFYNYLPFFIIVISILEVTISMESKMIRQSLNFDPCHKKQIYRFATYMLVHANLQHMAMNVLIQLFLGTPMEIEQGHLRAAAIYIGGGLGGSLGSSVIDPETVVEGASAGVYAILMSQISHFVLNFPELRFKWTRGLAVGVLLAADIGHTSYHVYTWKNKQPRISLPAHMCGALSGLLLGLFILKGSSKWTTIIKIISGTILIILYLIAILLNILKH